jgi:hypothetical protein
VAVIADDDGGDALKRFGVLVFDDAVAAGRDDLVVVGREGYDGHAVIMGEPVAARLAGRGVPDVDAALGPAIDGLISLVRLPE